MILKSLAILPAIAGLAFGVIGPQFQREKQVWSPEHVEIDIVRITKSGEPKDAELKRQGYRVDVTLEARVVAVHRSATKLQRGDTITIEYSTYLEQRSVSCGSIPIPIPERGANRAFLRRRADSKVYGPAAGHVSFARLRS